MNPRGSKPRSHLFFPVILLLDFDSEIPAAPAAQSASPVASSPSAGGANGAVVLDKTLQHLEKAGQDSQFILQNVAKMLSLASVKPQDLNVSAENFTPLFALQLASILADSPAIDTNSKDAFMSLTHSITSQWVSMIFKLDSLLLYFFPFLEVALFLCPFPLFFLGTETIFTCSLWSTKSVTFFRSEVESVRQGVEDLLYLTRL